MTDQKDFVIADQSDFEGKQERAQQLMEMIAGNKDAFSPQEQKELLDTIMGSFGVNDEDIQGE